MPTQHRAHARAAVATAAGLVDGADALDHPRVLERSDGGRVTHSLYPDTDTPLEAIRRQAQPHGSGQPERIIVAPRPSRPWRPGRSIPTVKTVGEPCCGRTASTVRWGRGATSNRWRRKAPPALVSSLPGVVEGRRSRARETRAWLRGSSIARNCASRLVSWRSAPVTTGLMRARRRGASGAALRVRRRRRRRGRRRRQRCWG